MEIPSCNKNLESIVNFATQFFEISMIDLNIKDETSRLKAVVLGTAKSFGGTPTPEHAYDPKSLEHIKNGTFPVERDLVNEMNGFEKVLEKYNVKVYRPEVIEGKNQVYSRDIGFVIDDIFVVSNIIKDREGEIKGIDYLHDQIDNKKIVRAANEVQIEGGDVIPWNNKIFVGYSVGDDFRQHKVNRTNKAGVDFLREAFPGYEVHAFELIKSDVNPRENALHLDCCFQPIGTDQAIIYEGGFKNKSDVDFLANYFGNDKIIRIDQDQMYNMVSNIFSISPEVIVSEKNFPRLNAELRKREFIVEEIPYAEVAKMEGLLRCSTLPLIRSTD